MIIDVEPFLQKSSAVPVRIRVEAIGGKAKPADIEVARCRRILVIKLDHIGDWILSTPFLENLRRNAPRAEIDLVVLPQVAELASSSPLINRVVAVKQKSDGTFAISAHTSAQAAAFRHDYAGNAFDLTIVPRWDADFEGAARIARGSNARFIVGFSECCTRRKRVINRGDDRFYTHVVDDRRTIHEVEHNLALLEAMNGRVIARIASLRLREADDHAAGYWLGCELGPRPRALVAIAPFCSEPKRRIPIRRFADLAGQIADTLGCQIVVIGGPDDRLRGAQLAAMLRPRAISAAGRLTVGATAALIRRCDALVGVDSAPVHLAAAVETPVAVLSCHPMHGSPNHANSPTRFAPWAPADRVLVLQPTLAQPPCRDCCNAAEPHCILGIGGDALGRLMTFIGKVVSSQAIRRTGSGMPASIPLLRVDEEAT